jgi:hypothetical protein
MTLAPEQTAAIASWIASGDNLSTVQKKLAAQYNLALTYMDVRFLVDDLNLTLKDPAPAPAAQADLSKIAPPQPGDQRRHTEHSYTADPFDADDLDDTAPAGAQPAPPQTAPPRADDPDDEDDALPPQMSEGTPGADVPATNIRVEVDNVTLLPGALASGSVTFTDGVTGNWAIDPHGRPVFTQISRQGYRPAPADAQAFMQELALALRKKGLM